MHHRLVNRAVLLTLLACVSTGCSSVQAQATAGRTADALSAVAEVMALRRGALGDSLPFEACTVFEETGRPSGFPGRLPPGLIPLLDRTGPDPCSTEGPAAGARFQRVVRVDSVRVTDSSATVHLSVKRGEWSYNEDYFFTALPNGRGWGFREARMTNVFRVTPPPLTFHSAGTDQLPAADAGDGAQSAEPLRSP